MLLERSEFGRIKVVYRPCMCWYLQRIAVGKRDAYQDW